SGRRRHRGLVSDWSSDVCSSDLSYRVERVIGGQSGVVEADRHIRAPLESLGVGKIARGRGLAAATKGAAAIDFLAVELQRAGEHGIEAGNERATAEG